MQQTGDAAKNERLILGCVPVLFQCYGGLVAHAGVCCVCGDRKSGARPKQSFGVKPRTGWGIYLGLEVADGPPPVLEPAAADPDFVPPFRPASLAPSRQAPAP